MALKYVAKAKWAEEKHGLAIGMMRASKDLLFSLSSVGVGCLESLR
jgi:hypothetical protein